MDYYSAQVIVRLEHKEKMRSAARMRAYRIAEVRQPRWVSRQLQGVLNLAGNGLIRVGKRLMPPQDIIIDIHHSDPQGRHAG